jgi:hypothetical protein
MTPTEINIPSDTSVHLLDNQMVLCENKKLLKQLKELEQVAHFKTGSGNIYDLGTLELLQTIQLPRLHGDTGSITHYNGAFCCEDSRKVVLLDFRPHKDVTFSAVLFSGTFKIVHLSRSGFLKQQKELGKVFVETSFQIDENTRILFAITSPLESSPSVDETMKKMSALLQNARDKGSHWLPMDFSSRNLNESYGFLLIKMTKNEKGKFKFDNFNLEQLYSFFPTMQE